MPNVIQISRFHHFSIILCPADVRIEHWRSDAQWRRIAIHQSLGHDCIMDSFILSVWRGGGGAPNEEPGNEEGGSCRGALKEGGWIARRGASIRRERER